eukprot:TRINITY_DN1304_c0_g1_i9.p1 TRINITY_DN1304_c0_g1~~TRINITY_DN1304_c0_g1_i9.p1  ORF type:complete len:220 (+),score=36.90 TRINITY_DN1304_c0_g1_i9:475-1134(+)
MEPETRSILVWPWVASNLKYHVVMDTFINDQVPDEPRSIYPPACNPTSPDQLPEPSVEFNKSLVLGASTINLTLVFIAGTGLAANDPAKSRHDRAKCHLTISSATCHAVVLLIAGDEAFNPLMDFYQVMFSRNLLEVPTFVVSIDDPDLKLVKEVQQKILGVTSNTYGQKFIFKEMSSTTSPERVACLLSEILTDAEVQGKESASKPTKSRSRGPCLIL